MLRRHLFWAIALMFGLIAPAHAAKNPDATVLHMQVFGEWEAWCVKRDAEPGPDCFVVNAVVYRPRPHFAAIVLRFYPPVLGNDRPRVVLGMEGQSLLARGYVRVDGQDVVRTADCLLPGTCTLGDDRARELIARFRAGKEVAWRHYDFGTDPVDITMDLNGFATAYEQVATWAEKL